MKTTLFSILWKKELKHWKRIKEMLHKFSGWTSKLTFGLIVVILVTVAHYLFAIMHTLYELFLFVVARKAFKSNLQKMAVRI